MPAPSRPPDASRLHHVPRLKVRIAEPPLLVGRWDAPAFYRGLGERAQSRGGKVGHLIP